MEMATMQVPGYIPANADRLHRGCWAEQGNRLLTMDKVTPDSVAFRTMDRTGKLIEDKQEMPVLDFQRSYSDKGWLWHDKTPAPLAA